MELTTLLAQIWGPGILAVGAGVFLSGSYYRRIYRDLEQSPLAVLTFGMAAIAAGITQAIFHTEWNTLPEIVVTVLGWGLLAKGAIFLLAPRFVDRAGDLWADRKLVPVAGILMLIMGGYLCWIGYA